MIDESVIAATKLGISESLNKVKIGDHSFTSSLAMLERSGILPEAADDVAARLDDAEAKAEDWDNWLVTSFVSPCGKKPLVCRGKYEEKKHARYLMR